MRNYQKKLYEYQEHEAETLIDIAVIYLEDDEFLKALQNLQEALKTYEKLNYLEGEAYTHDLIGDTYLTTRNTKKALEHYQKAFKLYADIDSSMENEMGEKIREVKQIETALNTNTEEAESFVPEDFIDELEENENTSIDSLNPTPTDSEDENLIKKVKKDSNFDLKELSSEIEEIILLLDQSELYSLYYNDPHSQEMLQEALKSAEIIEDWDGQGTLHLMLGNTYLKLENSLDSLKQFQSALKIFETHANKKGEAISLLLIGALYFIFDKKNEMYMFFRKSLNIFHKHNFKKEEEMAIKFIEILSN
ncbi:MAG: tetratricopeptide repeat protein [Euryarchaeota archaeon]|nr:tetratricopeptide repeat protein [Euryarchaeota archaeon]MBU4547772.1 tetratricopeptide repeat protein [Euryarchaeota archaeon]MBU4607072.1 tetratricopeptide repeat protein [Euryarchaeota archaeon]MBV1755740.1 tetratricopeptide repeat protein [Methanobacterium sp.]